MYVQIEEHDALVINFACHTRGTDGKEMFHRVVIVQQDGDSGVYTTCWGSHYLDRPVDDENPLKLTLIWRGNFDKCLDNFEEIVGDLLTEVVKLPNGHGVMSQIA